MCISRAGTATKRGLQVTPLVAVQEVAIIFECWLYARSSKLWGLECIETAHVRAITGIYGNAKLVQPFFRCCIELVNALDSAGIYFSVQTDVVCCHLEEMLRCVCVPTLNNSENRRTELRR